MLRLSISRRPTLQLLNAYNALFASMSERYPELGAPLSPHEGTIEATNGLPPLTLLDPGGRDDRPARVRRVAQALEGLIGKPLDVGDGRTRPLEPGDIAILFRGNEALTDYERQLRGGAVEVRRVAGTSFYRRPEVEGVHRLLWLLLDHPSDLALMHAMQTPYLGDVGLTDVEASILWYGRREGHELTDRFEQEHPALATRLRELRGSLRTDTVPELLGRMDERLGMTAYHRRLGDAAGEDGLERLREVARRLFRSEQALTAGAFAQHLARCIRDDADGPELSPPAGRPPYVRLMTVHAAKGLEFPVVIVPELHAPAGRTYTRFVADDRAGLDVMVGELEVPTASAGFWQRVQRGRQADLFEEMRIFYVAVTRAQNHVVLVGADTERKFAPGEREYGWQDEVLAAWPRLEGLGAWRWPGIIAPPARPWPRG